LYAYRDPRSNSHPNQFHTAPPSIGNPVDPDGPVHGQLPKSTLTLASSNIDILGCVPSSSQINVPCHRFTIHKTLPNAHVHHIALIKHISRITYILHVVLSGARANVCRAHCLLSRAKCLIYLANQNPLLVSCIQRKPLPTRCSSHVSKQSSRVFMKM
jgi:hypothetical protein